MYHHIVIFVFQNVQAQFSRNVVFLTYLLHVTIHILCSAMQCNWRDGREEGEQLTNEALTSHSTLELVKKFFEVWDLILWPSDYKSEALPTDLTSQLAGAQNFSPATSVIHIEQHSPIQTPLAHEFNHPIEKKSVTLVRLGLWVWHFLQVSNVLSQISASFVNS